MIPVPDLCIGNWVYDGDRTQFPMFIRAIGEDYVYLDFEGNEGDLWESKPEELQGIPITEDLLTKMGAKKVTDIGWNVVDSYNAGVKIELRILLWSESEIEVKIRRETPHWVDMFQSNVVHYLHELQNLFWNVTKHQLNIKL